MRWLAPSPIPDYWDCVLWEQTINTTKRDGPLFSTGAGCVCVCRGGGGRKVWKIFTCKHLFTCGSCCKHYFFGFSVLLQTLFYFHTNYFRVSASANNLFQNFPTPPTPVEKKIDLSPRRSEIMLKLKPGRRHLSMNTSQSGSPVR